MLVAPAARRLPALGARRAFSGVKYEGMSVGIPKETFARERRVAASPATVALLKKAGFGEVRVEKGAGALASYGDAGCRVRRKMDRAGPLARERSETVELPPRIRRDAALREISGTLSPWK